MSLGCNATVDCECSSFCTALFLDVSVMRLSGHGDDFGRNFIIQHPRQLKTAVDIMKGLQ